MVGSIANEFDWHAWQPTTYQFDHLLRQAGHRFVPPIKVLTHFRGRRQDTQAG